MKMGSPTKYSDELLGKSLYYLEHFEILGDEIPSNVGLALYLEVHRDTVQVWGKEEGKDEFSYILDRIQAKQQQVLINKGLNNKFNSSICKLVLGKHGFHDKQDLESQGGFTVNISRQDANNA